MRPKLKQRNDGRYRCKRKGLVFYGKSSIEAYAKRDAYDVEIAQGLRHEEAGITVAEYADKWLPIHRHDSCPKSYSLYQKVLDEFCDFLGNCRLRDVTPSDIQEYYNTLGGFSASYISKHTVTISSMFRAAFADGIISRDPCAQVRRPDGSAGTHRVIESWERDAIHRLVGHRFGVCMMLMLYAGLRRGEALAFDLDRDIVGDRVYVRGSVSYSYGTRPRVKSPKTASGARDLPLLRPLADAVNGRHGMAFQTARGGETTESAFQSAWNSYKRAFRKLTGKECTIRTHDLRHSYCTMLCDAGVDMKTAMSWMGHSDEAMIRKIYDHLTEKREKLAEKNIADLIDKNL